jgi:epoxyqueuosine reductase
MALASNQVKQYAHTLGFDACRILPVGKAPHAAFFDAWLDQGHAGEMEYLLKHRARRHSPALLADEKGAPFHSLIVLAVNYHQVDLAPILRNDPSRGVIAAYAWGDDYHEIMRRLLYALDAFIRAQSGRTTLGKCLVDTGPVLERDWAHRAGIGFTGKNCCTIAPHQGSWLLLATLLVPEVLPYDQPIPETESIPVEAVLAGLPAAKEYGRHKGWKRLEVTTPPLPEFDRTFHFYETQGFDIAGGKKMKVLL